jgi:hypothetical protein
VERRGIDVDDIHAHLSSSRVGEPQADCLHAVHAPARRAYGACDVLRDDPIFRREHEVVRDQHVTGADEHYTCSRVDTGMAIAIRRELSGFDPPLEFADTASAEERRPVPAPRVPVQEDGQAEVVRKPASELPRHRDRARHVVGVERDDRDDVRDADAWVHALVPAKIDPVDREREAAEQGLDQPILVRNEREDRSMVIRIRVHVEQECAHAEGVSERPDELGVASFGDVGHGLEHAPYPMTSDQK